MKIYKFKQSDIVYFKNGVMMKIIPPRSSKLRNERFYKLNNKTHTEVLLKPCRFKEWLYTIKLRFYTSNYKKIKKNY